MTGLHPTGWQGRRAQCRRGVSLMPRISLGNRRPGVVVRKVRGPEPVRTIHAAVRKTSLPQPALRGLLDALREAAAQ
ncbi:LysR substrate-binding domain-containing protein [Streptomyces sp. NPDC023998]|uniref:LysR substrate-binding domain-containing protein n=1 Tax=Streptomyces sp. NPDC023998 TaxID=3154597 RepID=UPI0033FC7E0C